MKQVNASFSFMKVIADFVTTLTSEEVQKGTRSNGMIYFTKEDGVPRIDYRNNDKRTISPHTAWFVAATIEKRSWAFGPTGPLAYMKPLIYENGKNNRRFLMEEITLATSKKTTSDDFQDTVVTTENVSARSILARAKNSFQESDSVNSISELSVWDLLYIRFVDDSHVYAISVEEKSRKVGDQITALCNITYKEGAEEITQEWIIRLPFYKNNDLIVTVRGKRVPALNQRISNIKLRKRRSFSTH